MKVYKARLGNWWVQDDITGFKVPGHTCGFGVDIRQGSFTQRENIGKYNSQFKIKPRTDTILPPTVRARSDTPWL